MTAAAALRLARQRLLRHQRAVLRDIHAEVTLYRAEIGRTLAQYRGVRPDLVRLTSDLASLDLVLTTALNRAVRSHRRLTITDMLTLWGEAGDRDVQRLARRLTEAAVYASLREGITFQTAMQTATGAAHGEIVALIAEGLRTGATAPEIAKAILPYLDGATTFPLPGGRLDLRRIPTPLRGQARLLRYHAERIAVTEMSLARAEAETLRFLQTPSIGAVQWVTAPDRGTTKVPDICDILASVNAYRLGPGIYPVDRVPPIPHPFCRCSRLPLPGPRVPGQTPFAVALDTVAGFRNHPPGMQARLTREYATALDDGGRLAAVVQSILPTTA